MMCSRYARRGESPHSVTDPLASVCARSPTSSIQGGSGEGEEGPLLSPTLTMAPTRGCPSSSAESIVPGPAAVVAGEKEKARKESAAQSAPRMRVPDMQLDSEALAHPPGSFASVLRDLEGASVNTGQFRAAGAGRQ